MNPPSPFAHLRPTTIPEMLDRAYAVATRFWPLLWGAGFVTAADHLLAAIFLRWNMLIPSHPLRVGSMLATTLAGDFAAAMALLGMFQGLIFPKRPISPRALLRTTIRKFPAYFLTHLACIILVAFCGIFASRLAIASLRASTYNLNLLLAAASGMAAVIFAIRLCLAPIACLIEDGSPPAAFKRSWHLTTAWPPGLRLRKDRPALRLVSILVLPLFVAVIVATLGLVIGVYGLRIPIPGARPSPVSSLMMELIAFFATGLAMPLLWAGLMAVYVEYRMRREALDFYLRLRELSRDTPTASPL